MVASFITNHGDVDVLQVGDIPTPVCDSKNKVLVKISYSGLNHADLEARRGYKFFGKPKGKKILGIDFTGIVEESLSSKFKKGDKVYGMISPVKGGAHAEYIALPDSHLHPVPEQVDMKYAASIITPAVTALHILSKLKPYHKNILINGAAGSVGYILSKIALQKGYKVSGICGSRNFDVMKKMGITNLFDYKSAMDWKTIGEFDAIIDCNGNLNYVQCKQAMSDRSVFITISIKGSLSNVLLNFVKSFFSTKKFLFTYASYSSPGFKEFKNLIASGLIEEKTEGVYKLPEIKQAHQHYENGNLNGRIVIKI